MFPNARFSYFASVCLLVSSISVAEDVVDL